MKKIIYSPHLEFRLRFREIPHSLPLKIYRTAKERYFDNVTNNYVAVQKLKFRGKLREIAVVFKAGEYLDTIITVHPLKLFQKLHRIKSGRWQRI